MKTFTITAIMATAMTTFLTAPAWATAPSPDVPEMSVGAGVAAIALLVGIATIIREKTKR
ncbi:MAG: hypothetical protein DHS20C05_14500 [Hyphococcus sp.]|nr:MAG: hypothetical protein DHS20C05_14500 [Marinicaulis sp.]